VRLLLRGVEIEEMRGEERRCEKKRREEVR
jgi:hypothetical protein